MVNVSQGYDLINNESNIYEYFSILVLGRLCRIHVARGTFQGTGSNDTRRVLDMRKQNWPMIPHSSTRFVLKNEAMWKKRDQLPEIISTNNNCMSKEWNCRVSVTSQTQFSHIKPFKLIFNDLIISLSYLPFLIFKLGDIINVLVAVKSAEYNDDFVEWNCRVLRNALILSF